MEELTYKSLRNLAKKAQNEKDKAQGKIYECRKQITEIRKEEAHWEGERDLADYFLSLIQQEMNRPEAKPEEQPEKDYSEGSE